MCSLGGRLMLGNWTKCRTFAPRGLSPGQMSGVIRSELLGYHVIQVLEREDRPISDTNLEVIKANQREAVRRWREQLWANATIERFIEP